MSLTSHTSTLHSHLSRRTGKKRSAIGSDTPAPHTVVSTVDAPKREAPFGQIQFDTATPTQRTAYKSIFGL